MVESGRKLYACRETAGGASGKAGAVLAGRHGDRPTGRGKGAYAKGLQRREVLLKATAELLRHKPLDQVSLKDIAEHADVPVGSAYHFFANAQAVYAELAARFMTQIAEVIAAPYSGEEHRSWQALFDAAVDRAARLYADNPAYRQLIIGVKAPPEIKLADRANDEQLGRLMIQVIDRHFIFPDFPESHRVFFHATEIVDLMFTLSVVQSGEISPEMVAEAKKAARAYLGEYLPEEMPPRPAG